MITYAVNVNCMNTTFNIRLASQKHPMQLLLVTHSTLIILQIKGTFVSHLLFTVLYTNAAVSLEVVIGPFSAHYPWETGINPSKGKKTNEDNNAENDNLSAISLILVMFNSAQTRSWNKLVDFNFPSDPIPFHQAIHSCPKDAKKRLSRLAKARKNRPYSQANCYLFLQKLNTETFQKRCFAS